MRKDIHCTIGGVELLREEVEMMYSQKLYIVAYTGVYQILFSQAQDRYHGQKVYSEKGSRQTYERCVQTGDNRHIRL